MARCDFIGGEKLLKTLLRAVCWIFDEQESIHREEDFPMDINGVVELLDDMGAGAWNWKNVLVEVPTLYYTLTSS